MSKISFKTIPNAKSVAYWLIEHTCLTFDQISDFCSIPMLEIKSIADGVDFGISKKNPIGLFLTRQEIERCEKNPKLKLVKMDHYLSEIDIKMPNIKDKCLVSRKDRASGVLYLLNNYKGLSDSKISKLTKTTIPTVKKISDKTFIEYSSLEEKNPIILGLCTEKEMEKALK